LRSCCLIGATALANGVREIVLAVRLPPQIAGEWLLALAGVVSILFGLVVLIFPGAGALALVWLIAVHPRGGASRAQPPG
jgi:uncharacterized membrane protein HdeD (DUF308 family)